MLNSNINADDVLPTVAYLPPFAGISSRENKMSVPTRRAMIGRGLAGAIIRNLLHDMYKVNEDRRSKLKAGRLRIKRSELEKLRREDPWEILQTTLTSIFNVQLDIEPFNDLFHTYIRVNCIKGKIVGKKFTRFPNFTPRDLMAEGSGFLQWLSVYTFALSPSFKTLLLDEPDAHLHFTLQKQLIDSLEEIAKNNGKQVLMATHSTEILRSADYSKILEFKGTKAKYLNEDKQKTGLLIGIGSNYAPKIDNLRINKCMLIVENESDARLLKSSAIALGFQWPKNVVIWPWTGSEKERKNMFLQLKSEIPELKVISIGDRDDINLLQVDKKTLENKGISDDEPNLKLRIWRRRHIENYLLCPTAIARASGFPVNKVEKFLSEHSLVVPGNFTSRDVATAMLDARGKQSLVEHCNSVKVKFNVDALKIAKKMTSEEIADDIKGFLSELIEMCN